MRRLESRRGYAFTLLELLIAISITTVLVVLLAQVLIAAAAQWRTADERIDIFRDARAALFTMAHDLSRANVSASAQMLTLSNYGNTASVPFAKEAFAVGPMANSGKSDLCTVGFYLVWDDINKAYRLKRLFRNSDDTVISLAHSPPAFTNLFTKPTTPAEQQNMEEDLATYVWDLRFSPGTAGDIEPVTANPSTKWEWLEVRFKAMSPIAARKLSAMNVPQSIWDDPNGASYKTLILPNEQDFITRIRLQQAP
jgi:type II secretory pathway pseudopilin PulG